MISFVEEISSQEPEWKNSTEYDRNMGIKLHTICSYMAMFPPAVPHYFISEYTNEGDVVLDPFSGRGTTVLQACAMNRKGIGNDKNPLAYLLTKSKCEVPQKGRIISRIKKLEAQFNSNTISVNYEESKIRMIFHDFTLKQLIFLKNELNWRTSNVDAFIAAMVMGILHGNSEGFLSLSMPNTFSMAPNYVKNFIKKHGLEKPKRNVFVNLLSKLDRCYSKPVRDGKAYNRDVRKLTKIKNSSVDLILTSPPYTRVIRYGEFNWIRLWFLSEESKSVDKKLFFSQSTEKYRTFMREALQEMKRVLKPSGKAILVIGDVQNRDKSGIFNLAEDVWENCAKPLGFKKVQETIADEINDGRKVTKIWGKKRGNATKVDRVLLLERPN